MTEAATSKYRTYPMHTLDDTMVVARMIRDHMAGKPMNRLLLADAMDIKPSSSNFRALLSSSLKYGLTVGTEKAEEIALTDLGSRAVADSSSSTEVLRKAAMTPPIFGSFYVDYNNNKIPSQEMLAKILTAKYGVSEKNAPECAELIMVNGQRVGVIRNISGSPHVILTAGDTVGDTPGVEDDPAELDQSGTVGAAEDAPAVSSVQQAEEQVPAEQSTVPPVGIEAATARRPKSIFLGHGRNVRPREKLERILNDFKIPFAVAVSEPNLGKPIPTKVRETMMNCGSAILIFTKDQKFLVEDGDGHREVWRPSENVVHELGAASLLYEDRIVIFKERGINLPSNFSSIGYIEFDEDGIEAKAVDLLKELIGFGLVTVSPA